MSNYEEYWDLYVRKYFPESAAAKLYRWPGDEWGAGTKPGENEATERFLRLFPPAEIESWRQTVEIGSGAGKYTALVFAANPAVRVLSFDVSSAFLEVLGQRFAAEVESGRLDVEHLKCQRPDEMLAAVKRRNLSGSIDAVYSIDAMVHVDLQYLIAYLLTAALILRPGGHLVLTLPDATTEDGFGHLLHGILPFFHFQGRPSGKFEWLSLSLVGAVLSRIGFDAVVLDHLPPGRDIAVVARLARPHEARLLRTALGAEDLGPVEVPSAADPPFVIWGDPIGSRCRLELSSDAFASIAHANDYLNSPYFRFPAAFWRLGSPGTRFEWRVTTISSEPNRVLAQGVIVMT